MVTWSLKCNIWSKCHNIQRCTLCRNCSHAFIQTVFNPQRACTRVIVVSLFVCLSTSDLEDGGVFMFETGINVN